MIQSYLLKRSNTLFKQFKPNVSLNPSNKFNNRIKLKVKNSLTKQQLIVSTRSYTTQTSIIDDKLVCYHFFIQLLFIKKKTYRDDYYNRISLLKLKEREKRLYWEEDKSVLINNMKKESLQQERELNYCWMKVCC